MRKNIYYVIAGICLLTSNAAMAAPLSAPVKPKVSKVSAKLVDLKKSKTPSDDAEARVLRKLTLLEASGEAAPEVAQKLHARFNKLAKTKDTYATSGTVLSADQENKLVASFNEIEKQIDTHKRVQTFASSWFDWF